MSGFIVNPFITLWNSIIALPLWLKILPSVMILLGIGGVLAYQPIVSKINSKYKVVLGESQKTYKDIFGIARPIDTTISQSTGSYQYKNTTNTFKSYYKNDPTIKEAIRFTNGESELNFYTPKEQSFGVLGFSTEESSGNTLTYQNVFDNMDIRYTVLPTRLLEEFIINSKDTAEQITEITQELNVKNITNFKESEGSLIFEKNGKASFIIPKPVMYEMENPQEQSFGIYYQITPLSDNSYRVAKIISNDGKVWLTDPKRSFPIVIDLVVDNADASGSWTSSDPTNTTVSQEGTIKQEGTGSVKVQTTTTTSNVDLMEYSSDGNAQAAFPSNATADATGGTLSTFGAYNIRKFTTTGTFTPGVTLSDYTILVVAGGGGGGGSPAASGGAGGGGAGGVLEYTSQTLTGGAGYTVTVGTGGGGGNNAKGTNGGNSQFGSLGASTGGGGGGAGNNNSTAKVGASGGSGGGGGYQTGSNGSGTSGQGYNGSAAFSSSGGGGGGKAELGGTDDATVHRAGGDGTDYSATYGTGFGVSGVVAGGGGGGSQTSAVAVADGGGGAGAGNTGSTIPTQGTDGTGGGGGGTINGLNSSTGADGGDGVVVVRYPTPPYLQSYSEATIKTQGTYALKGVANQTTSLNKTLTRTISPTLDLTDATQITFDMRSSRTGSNIKIGIHDLGGTTTEITPNITVGDTFQGQTWDISGVSNANKDAIDQIIVTIVNADSANTFYIDNIVATISNSLNDTVTLTTSAVDLSGASSITYWVRSPQTGTFAQFEFGETASSEQTNSITIDSADTWEQKTWDISGISSSAKNAVTKWAFKFTAASSGAAFYFDDIISISPPLPPTIGSASALSTSSIRWGFTDNASNESGFKVYDTSNNLVATCAGTNLSTCDETESALSINTQYTRKVVAYNADGNSAYSSTVSKYTLAEAPAAPTVTDRATTTINVDPNLGNNPDTAATTLAIYKEIGTTCDGSGGSYIAADGSDNGSTAVWQTNTVWATKSVTGLSADQGYAFCVKARNGDNVETGFGPAGYYNVGYIPIGDDYIFTGPTPAATAVPSDTFSTRYVDGSNGSRYVLGVDSGTSDSEANSANFELKTGTLALNANDTLVVGSLDLTGGSITIATGAQIQIGQAICAVDQDNDGYTSDRKLHYYRPGVDTPPSYCKRKKNFTHFSANDCDDAIASSINGCVPTKTGDGRDGSVTISSNLNINTTDTSASIDTNGASADGVVYAVSSFGTDTSPTPDVSTVTTSSTPTGIVAGDEVLIINLQGGQSTYTNVGNYEPMRVYSVNGSTITLQTALTKTFGNANNSDLSNQKIVIQRVPNYTDATINDGVTLTASAWDGTSGGIVALRASGTLTVGNTTTGSISTTGLGYVGAQGGATSGPGGESFCGSYGTGGTASNVGSAGSCGGGGGGGSVPDAAGGSGSSTGGAGGGGGQASCGSYVYTQGSGGGAGYGSAGVGANNGGTDTSGSGGSGSHSGTQAENCADYSCGGGNGGGGGTYGVANLSKIYFGSGGGGGALTSGGGDGGNGGGIIFIGAGTLALNGTIESRGTAGTVGGAGNCGGTGVRGDGGTGAGGSIYITSTSGLSLGTNKVTALKDTTYNDGGDGRIAAPSGSTGSTTPTFTGI